MWTKYRSNKIYIICIVMKHNTSETSAHQCAFYSENKEAMFEYLFVLFISLVRRTGVYVNAMKGGVIKICN